MGMSIEPAGLLGEIVEAWMFPTLSYCRSFQKDNTNPTTSGSTEHDACRIWLFSRFFLRTVFHFCDAQRKSENRTRKACGAMPPTKPACRVSLPTQENYSLHLKHLAALSLRDEIKNNLWD